MNLAEATSMLARTPATLDALLTDLPAPWLHRDDGPGTWSAYDIVGHLVHGEAADWLPRTRMILEFGPSRPFDPFDRAAMLRESILLDDREPATALLARFRDARAAGLDELASLGLSDADMHRHGLHPELGEVTLGQLLATWVAHDLTHVGQVGEVLARHYRDDVGPWRAYLPALDRTAEAE
jgi:DinB superfamily